MGRPNDVLKLTATYELLVCFCVLSKKVTSSSSQFEEDFIMYMKFTLNSGRTRSCSNVYLQRPRTEFYRRSFEHGGGMMWNDLPNRLKGITSLSLFKLVLREYMLSNFILLLLLSSSSMFCNLYFMYYIICIVVVLYI